MPGVSIDKGIYALSAKGRTELAHYRNWWSITESRLEKWMDRSLWDEISPDAGDTGVLVQWFGVQCLCRCRHCALRNTGAVTTVPFQKARALADRFVVWKAEHGTSDFSVDIHVGSSCDYPELPEVTAFNIANGGTGPYCPIKGQSFRSEDELRGHLRYIAEIGITCVCLTFFGLRERHDRFCGRKGDFDQTMRIARLADECGLERRESIMLTHDGVSDAPELIRILDEIPNQKGRSIGTWDYRGRAKRLENERLTITDIEGLPADIRQYAEHGMYASEADWIRRIRAGDYPRKVGRVYLITLQEDNVESLESMGCGEILRGMREGNEAFLRSIPSMPDLADLYGNENGDRYYRVRDLEWKWTDQYLEAHPEVNPAGHFDDLDIVVMWH